MMTALLTALLIWAYVSDYDDSSPGSPMDSDNDDDDIADANTYEVLLHGENLPISILTHPFLHVPPQTEFQDVPPDLPDHSVAAIAAGHETPALVVDPFSSGAAGALITDPDSVLKHADSTQESHNIWAPFHSQCDWEIAHWVKMRGPASSAVDELFAIPRVCISDILMLSMYLNTVQGCR